MRTQTEFSIKKGIIRNKYEVTEKDIEENLERAEKGLPLLIPLVYLNDKLKKRFYQNDWRKENPEKIEKYKKDEREKYRKEYPLEMVVCRNCKNKFMPSKRGVLYCSRKCQNKNYYEKNKENWNIIKRGDIEGY